MSDEIETLLESSLAFDDKTITVVRSLILFILAFFRDGVQFREFQTSLKISDGKLISNLKFLTEMGYIKKEEVEIDGKKLDVYFITTQGRKEIEKISSWMENLVKIIKDGGLNHGEL